MSNTTENQPTSINDKLEVIVLAIIIALIIRYYCLEAFKIPSCSMEPTLIGDIKCGDHILVNKSAYLWKQPRRWDVIVFKYPHNTAKNFIKRLVGLPNETITIKNGNIYINGYIARKPDVVQKVLLYPLFTPKELEAYQDYWQTDAKKWTWTQNYCVGESKEKVWNEYAAITNRYIPEQDKLFFYRAKKARSVGGDEYVGEMRFSFVVKPLSTQGKIIIYIRNSNNHFYCHLGLAKESSFTHYIGENQELKKQIKIPYLLIPDNQNQICFSNLDDLVTLQINGKELINWDYSQHVDKTVPSTYHSALKWGIENGKFLFSNIHLSRDIYYLGKKDFYGGMRSWKIPKNHYFTLGDNPPNSRDSRDWQRFCLFLKKTGIGIEGDQNKFPHGTIYKFTDIYGIKRKIPREDVKEHRLTHQESPFVPKSYLIGQGFATFWPPTRVKIIR